MNDAIWSLQLQYGRAIYQAEKWRREAELVRQQIDAAAAAEAVASTHQTEPSASQPSAARSACASGRKRTRTKATTPHRSTPDAWLASAMREDGDSESAA